MKTGNKIAWFYTAVTTGIIAVVAAVFYIVATHYIDRLYLSSLTEKAYAIAEKHWEKDEVGPDDYALIQKHYEETLPVVSEILLNADSLTESQAVLSRYLKDDEIQKLYRGDIVSFEQNKQLGVAVYYPDNEGNFIVLVVSNNQYGGDIRQRIGWLLLGMLLISFVLIYFVGRLYATRMVDRIDAAYQSEKSFISNASHELNNPLTAIQGECEITLMKERTPAEYQAALGRITYETKRIVQLMKNLLFLSHGDKEIQKNAREMVFLADFLRQFTDGRISFQTDTFAYCFEANPHLLKIAIGNLLNNACKYSGEAPVHMCLRTNILEITDQGIGIPAADIKRIFQPFYRAGNTREFAGQGIGLSLSIRILNSYGANVKILSKEGEGTTVRIEFP